MASDSENSFGIKKIVDCKIDETGQQVYKVKWQETWEQAGNLVSCQHLIDEFWSFVNQTKSKEQIAQQHRKRMCLQQEMRQRDLSLDLNMYKMSGDNKADIQSLIARTSGNNQLLVSPSNALNMSPQNFNNNLMGVSKTPTHGSKVLSAPRTPTFSQKSLMFDSPDQKKKITVKSDQEDTKSSSGSSSNDSLFANWTNPYVTVHFKCRICQKEIPKPNYWKKHYSFHTEGSKFPCSVCGKTFKQQCDRTRHEKNVHFKNAGGNQVIPKMEVKPEMF